MVRESDAGPAATLSVSSDTSSASDSDLDTNQERARRTNQQRKKQKDSSADAKATKSPDGKKHKANRKGRKSSGKDDFDDNRRQGETTRDLGHGVVSVKDFKEDLFFGRTRLHDNEVDLDPNTNQVVLRNVHKTYLLGVEGVPALRGVTMNIQRGEFIVIFGTSGGGKTTMLNILGTIDKPTKGELFIGGTRITESTKDHELSDLRLRKIGFVFQTFNLLSSLTALENVEMPLILDGRRTASERRTRAKEVLGLVGMSGRLDHVPSQLSGGEQQRVTIARALSNQPEMLLLDEPTGDLDTVNTLIVMKLLADLNRDEGITMCMVTHDVSLKYFANRVVWMRDGKIQRIESVSEQKREETYAKLCSDLQDVRRTKKKRAKRGHSTLVELRKPTDYATSPQHKQVETIVVDAAVPSESDSEQQSSSESDSFESSD